ncbi:MAG: hypothetical protein QW727_02550 [Candidatus Pacearchaeota archaeon]
MIINFKKAQEGLTWMTIIGGIIAIGILIVVALFIFGFFDTLERPINQLPSELVAKAELCKSLGGDFPLAFCEFKLVSSLPGKKGDQYINCEYSEFGFQEALKDMEEKPDCVDNLKEDFCNGVDSNKRETTFVNDVPCSNILNVRG